MKQLSYFSPNGGSHLFCALSFICAIAIALAATETPIAREYKAFGPLPYTSSERGVNPLESIHSSLSFFDMVLMLDKFPSESAIGGSATWRDCHYNSSAKGEITAPFPDADYRQAYNAWAVANFSVKEDIGHPQILQCSNPASIRTLSVEAPYKNKVDEDAAAVTECPADVYEDGRSLCSVRLWPGSYQIFVHLASRGNATSFYCNYFIDPHSHSHSLLLSIDDTVAPSAVISNSSGRLSAVLAGAHCSVTVMNLHHRFWASSGEAELRNAPTGLRLAPHSAADRHYPLPRIAPRQVRQLRIDLLTDSTFLHTEASLGNKVSTFNISIVVKFKIGSNSTHECSFQIPLDVAEWRKSKSYHFTYIDVDGSVQAAAVLPPRRSCRGAPAGQNACPVLLSTHGAGVNALGRAWTESYKTQDQSWVLLPTGRRKYGLNWEGPQLKSAITALDRFAEALPGVPVNEKGRWRARNDFWLQAGHSMGGHGALLISTHFPDMLVAAVPAMGWLRLSTYSQDEQENQLPYSDAVSRALLTIASAEFSADLYAENLLGIPFLARVGSDDTNVPPANLRKFVRLLKENEFFANFTNSEVTLDEVKGQGHWFDGVVDDDVLQAFFNKHLTVTEKPRLPPVFSLVTVNPASSGSRGGLSILSLEVVFQLSKITIRRDYPSDGVWTVNTKNVRRLRYKPVPGVKDCPLRLLIDTSENAIPIDPEDLRMTDKHVDLCAIPTPAKAILSYAESKSLRWRICSDSQSWGSENSQERGPDITGPSAQILERRKLLIVFPEGDYELQDAAVSYANSLYLRGVSVQLTPDSNVSIQLHSTAGESNMVLLGGPNMNRMAKQHFDTGYSADVAFRGNSFCVASRCFHAPGTGVSFLSLGPKRTLLYFTAGTDREGLFAALSFLPYSPASNTPEWVVVSKRKGWGFRGLGGVLGLGYWDHLWRLEVRKSYPPEFADGLKRSDLSCAAGGAPTSKAIISFFFIFGLVATLLVAILTWRRASSGSTSIYAALHQTEITAARRKQPVSKKEESAELMESLIDTKEDVR